MTTHEQKIAFGMDACQHFHGIQRPLCGAGINIRLLVGGPDAGWAARLPCFLSDAPKCEVTCESRKLATREEAELEVVKQEQEMDHFLKVHRGAKDHAKAKGLGRGNGGTGEFPCPSGCGGTLRYSVASVNGHMHGRCSTKGCASWME